MAPADSVAVEAAVTWMRQQLNTVGFGRVGIAAQTHNGKITKIFRTIEDSLIAGPSGEAGRDNGSR